MPTLENHGLQILFALIGLALMMFFFAKWRSVVRYQRRKREHELSERNHKKILDRQNNLGRRIYNRLVNVICNLGNYRLQIQRVVRQEKNYCIRVSWWEDSGSVISSPRYPVVQINVDMAESVPIVVSYGPYPGRAQGVEVYYDASEEQINMMLEAVGNRIKNYSPYAPKV